ncbi:MAG: G5 domain-containing protein, partial [Firmicutes bacterium]|nr:G5 domain-containing protein [Bacillota bacterium]
TKGQNGLKRATYNITTENGIEIRRELVSAVTVKNPVAQVVAVGTGEKKSAKGQKVVAANAGATLSYLKKITVTATAYTDHSGNKTASGRMPQYGVIAVDPKVIPLGTRLYVESTDDGKSWTYGYCVAGDTGGAIKGNKIDLFYNTEGECVRFGRRTAIVYVLD